MKNMDRVSRVVLSFILIGVVFSGITTGLFGTIALILSVIFFATGMVGVCPIYNALGMTKH